MVGVSNNFVSTQNNYFKDGTKVFSSYRSEIKGVQTMKSLPIGNIPSNMGSSSVNNFTRTKTNLNNNFNSKQEIWVKKWVDYSTKYGLGYLLSNGSTGVYFNDSTKIILEPKGQ